MGSAGASGPGGDPGYGLPRGQDLEPDPGPVEVPGGEGLRHLVARGQGLGHALLDREAETRPTQ